MRDEIVPVSDHRDDGRDRVVGGQRPHDAPGGPGEPRREPSAVRSEFAWKTNGYMLDYVKFADAKAGAILTFAGLVGGGIASTAPQILADARVIASTVGWCTVGALGMTLALAVAVGVNCLRALQPRVPVAASLHSFPDIAGMTIDEYIGRVAELQEGHATAVEYCKHNWALSKVASAKFASIATATRFLRWMLLAGAVYGCIAVAVRFIGHPIAAL